MASYAASRTTGQYPLSVATSLAIESVMGIHPEIVVEKPPILDYEEVWINLRTLFRNLIGSLDKAGAEDISSTECKEALVEEMETIHNIVQEGTNSLTHVVYYISDYQGIEAKYPYAVVRRDSTAKQKQFTSLMVDTMGKLLKHYKEGQIVTTALKLHPKVKTKALIITHVVYDLVAHNQFKQLTLLESHTGALKEQSQWHTKYLNGKELAMIPFREDMLQIFGDSETFRPMDPKIRKELVDLAVRYNWSAVTKTEKIRYGIGQLQNHYAREILHSILV